MAWSPIIDAIIVVLLVAATLAAIDRWGRPPDDPIEDEPENRARRALADQWKDHPR